MIPAMPLIKGALGVQCEFCHLAKSVEKDDEETKMTASKMMRMMFIINKDNFHGQKEVTWYACHRGTHKPVATPVIVEESSQLKPEENKNQEAANVGSVPNVDRIIEKYLQAGGGTQAAKTSTRLQKGMLTVGTAQFPVEVLAKGPGERVTTVRFPNGDSVTGFNRQAGWLSTPGRGVHEMSSADVDAARLDAYPQFGVDPRQIFKELRVQKPEKVDGRETYMVSTLQDNLPSVQLYFDEESGLLVRMSRYVDTPLGLNPAQIDYGAYREVGGLKTPFRWTIARPGGWFTIQINQMQQDIPIDDEKFANPAAPVQPEH
mgnify:CR=1 FL=1